MMAQRMDPELRRKRIVEQATALIAREGYKGLTLRGLARECDMTAPGLMHYFPDLPSVLIEVLALRDEQDLAALKKRETSAPDAVSMRAMLDAIIEGIIARPAAAQLFAMLEAEALDPDHPAYNYFRTRARESVVSLAPSLDPAITDPEAFGARIMAVFDGLQLHWLRDPEGFDLRGHWAIIADALIAAATAPPRT